MSRRILASITALLAGGLVAGCANDGNLLAGMLTTASLNETASKEATPQQKVDPQCVALMSKIDALRKEGTPERIEKAAAGKGSSTQVKRESLARITELDKANAEFQARCSKLSAPQQAAVAPPAAEAAAAANTTDGAKAGDASKGSAAAAPAPAAATTDTAAKQTVTKPAKKAVEKPAAGKSAAKEAPAAAKQAVVKQAAVTPAAAPVAVAAPVAKPVAAAVAAKVAPAAAAPAAAAAAKAPAAVVAPAAAQPAAPVATAGRPVPSFNGVSPMMTPGSHAVVVTTTAQ